MIPEWNSFINADCMEYLKQFPDNYFDLAITDPPYGAGFTEGGGCKGWFTKYHHSDGGGKSITDSAADLTDTKASKTGKKLFRGMLPLGKNILKNFSASHGIRLYGAAITLNFHRQDALLYGRN